MADTKHRDASWRDQSVGYKAGWAPIILRGLRKQCPRCGLGPLFLRYLGVRDHCESCGLAFEPFRADDAPAYFTIFIVGHIVVSLYLALDAAVRLPPSMQAAIWLPVTLGLSLWLLPPIKGAVMAVIFKTKAAG